MAPLRACRCRRTCTHGPGRRRSASCARDVRRRSAARCRYGPERSRRLRRQRARAHDRRASGRRGHAADRVAARGSACDVAYLSLTRGDGGQNLIGNELGDALGVIRTEELLAARRARWRAPVLHARVRLRFFEDRGGNVQALAARLAARGRRDGHSRVPAARDRLRVLGHAADGHGHHQVSGLLAREAYDVSGDTVRFPVKSTQGLGAVDRQQVLPRAVVLRAARIRIDTTPASTIRCSASATPSSRRSAGRTTEPGLRLAAAEGRAARVSCSAKRRA